MSITLIIILGTCLISYLGFQNREVIVKTKFWPFEMSRHGEWHRFLTHGFVHADWMHLGINMFVLYSFGQLVEGVFDAIFDFGTTAFLLFYLAAIVAASLPGYSAHKNNAGFASVGASGATSAVVFASILFAPWSPLYLYGIIKIPAVIFGAVYLVYSSWASRNSQDNIDHSAHFWGAVFGFSTPIIFKPELGLAFLSSLLEVF